MLLADAGFLAIGIDIVGHGERRYPDFEQRFPGHDQPHAYDPAIEANFLSDVLSTAQEVPAIIDDLLARGWSLPILTRLMSPPTSAVAVLSQNFTLHEIGNQRYDFCFLAAKHVIAIFNLIYLCQAVLRFEQLNRIFDWYNGVFTLVMIADNTQNRNVNVLETGEIATLPKGQPFSSS
jgi:hypothetical protein